MKRPVGQFAQQVFFVEYRMASKIKTVVNQQVPLVEGIDYTIENGLFVFTSHYLKNRGYCCQNGCKNCPYGFKKDSKASI